MAAEGDAPLFGISPVGYVARADFLLSRRAFLMDVVRAVEIPRERDLDINTSSDMLISEALVGKVGLAGQAKSL